MVGNRKISKKKVFKTVIFVIGFITCTYPLLSSLIVQRYQKNTVATYEKMVAEIDDSYIREEYDKANEYNRMLYKTKGLTLTNIQQDSITEQTYDDLLDVSDNGIMGSIEIPKIDVNLPIYHGTSDEVLNIGIGHVEDSSLPVGGKNTRAVLTGHRGLPNSKLFTRLDEMQIGDLFFITVLSETMAYKVCDIDVIVPEDTKMLEIQDERDLISLLTCTPYGINTHRLLVTGERVTYEAEEHKAIESQMESPRELIFTCLPFIFLGIVIIRIIKSVYMKRKSKKGGNRENKRL